MSDNYQDLPIELTLNGIEAHISMWEVVFYHCHSCRIIHIILASYAVLGDL